MTIARAAVLGAGTMGAQIAAHIANAGIPVLLLDVVPDGTADRDVLAKAALARLAKQDPTPFTTKGAAALVEPGNLDDDLGRLAEADWIVEAVVERIEIKHALYERVAAVRKPDAMVTSNTSTLRRALLVEDMPDDLRRHFVITHFFNPPRYMRLVELVAGPEVEPEPLARLTDVLDHRLGKTVVPAADRPGFIANRIGTFWIQLALNEAIAHGIPVEEADLVLSRPFGIPKTGVFALADLVGLDLLPHVAGGLQRDLPADDPFQAVYQRHALVERMIADGHTGRKGKGGFYRLNAASGARVKEALDLTTGAYRTADRPRLDVLELTKRDGPAALFADPHPASRFAAQVIGRTLAYAAHVLPDIADDPAAIDAAMRLGYGWKHGPFALIDRIGPQRLAAWLVAEGHAVPPILAELGDATFYRVETGRLQVRTGATYADIVRPAGTLLLEDVKRRSEPLARNGSAAIWDIGDGVACLEFTSKMNALDPDSVALVERAVRLVPQRGLKALVVYNEGENFSVGANLGIALFAANVAAWALLEQQVEAGQRAWAALRYAPFPVVAAPFGLTLGGGCEICLHADAIQAHAETYIGLVEAGVGIVPAWGGCTRMLERLAADPRLPKGPMPAVGRAFETIGTAKVARSAFEARELGFMRADDGITMNRDRLLADAKARALALAADYRPPEKAALTLPGSSGRVALGLALDGLRRQGKATAHDAVVATELAGVLAGNGADMLAPVPEQAVLDAERAAFMRLVRTPGTLARMEHMLATGKPLRN